MKIREIEDLFESVYPSSGSSPWDNDGLLICSDRERNVSTVLTCLDVTFDVIEEAILQNAELIISHHPLIFKPISCINEDSIVGQKILRLMENQIALLSLHTRMDTAPNGLNAYFGQLLGVIREENAVILPEEPLIGGIGSLDEKLSPLAFAGRVSQVLDSPVKLFSADLPITRVGYCCGAGKDLVEPCFQLGADVFVSGDLSYHVVQDAVEKGMSVIDCGHFASEKYAPFLLADVMKKYSDEICVIPFAEKDNGIFVDFSRHFCSNSTT